MLVLTVDFDGKKTSKTPDDVLSALRAPCGALMSLLMKAGFQRNALNASQVASPPENIIERKHQKHFCAWKTQLCIPLTG